MVGADGKWETNASCLERLKVEPLQKLIACRKGIWIGHQARRQWRDPSASAFLQDRSTRTNKWWSMTKKQFERCGVTAERVLEVHERPCSVRKLFDSRPTR